MPFTLDIALLYQEHRSAMLAFFARRTGDGEAALDLMAETFAVAVAGRARFRGNSVEQATAWLYGIANRQLSDFHRRGYARDRALRRLGLERPERNARIVSEVEDAAALNDLRNILDLAFGSLSDSVRDAVRLRIVEGRTYADISTQLGVAETAVRARVSRGLTAMADVIDRDTLQELRTT